MTGDRGGMEQLLRTGTRRLVSDGPLSAAGDVSRFAVDELADALRPAHLEIVDADHAASTELVRDPDQPTRAYASVRPAAADGTYRFAPDDSFRAVGFDLVGVADATSVVVDATFEMASGARREHRRGVRDTDRPSGSAVPVEFSLDEPATAATFDVSVDRPARRRRCAGHCQRLADALSDGTYRYERPAVGRPVADTGADRPPVVLVSVDTLRYDVGAEMAPLLEALGDDAVVPAEPRTQGNWTPVSHATMLTGVHPADHGYVSTDGDRRINPDLPTLGTELSALGYRCSGLVSLSFLLPEFGFGAGFHRYRLQQLENWLSRENDVRTDVDRLLAWIDRDARGARDGLCYFLHVLDPHMPYVPPLERVEEPVDMGAVERFREVTRTADVGADMRPDDALAVDPDVVETVRSYYRASVRYTAEQLARLVDGLKQAALFDDALVVVTGDHGEEWGERGVYAHKGLYDANIRPFIIVKPPASADWTVPDRVDTLDILPTAVRAAGGVPPEECRGRPLQDVGDGDDGRPRITERVGQKWYHVAVESDGVKGIFAYPSAFPDRPTDSAIDAGPVNVEFHRLDAVRRGEYDGCGDDLAASTRKTLERLAASFARAPPVVTAAPDHRRRDDLHPEDQLRYLGYT